MRVDLTRYGNMHNCLRHLERSRREVLEVVEGLDEARFFRKPEPEAWCAAEVLEHIARVEDSAARVIRRLRRAVGGEPLPQVRVAPGRFRPDGRAVAPEVVAPKGGLSRAEVLRMLGAARAFLLAEVHASEEVLEAPVTFPHPFFGALTALGWLRVAAFHERHHLRQLRRIVSGPS
ncbi:DinB family protein [Marinithermus hydrothermalis]|uniref:DinB-like domain-containing protein n=1 Tax=Marinithermus hydrothermalis (strain DSM 14884 / JCM 11576 / T1) TaxID=869210 RepID=F2NQ05_MARHT|nr:DinB family protein [Marinithermus hydrothermalis]AEB11106.1 hypothetical protein Marky_0352 [Marinithermus hydrothermalis DSM 14884]